MSPTRPELAGSFGMVAASHWLAAATGMGVLERGGNAFDAAVSAGFVLQVVEPHLNGPGGEVPILAYSAAEDRVRVVCGQGPLPAGASVAALCDLGLVQVPGTGLLPACVPGVFGAWMALLETHGTLEAADALGPAIAYASGGFRLLPRAAATVAACEELFRNEWPSSAEVYLPGGGLPVAGHRFANPLLGATYARILEESAGAPGGREGRIRRCVEVFYEGFVAEAVDRFVSATRVLDDSGGRHGGLLTGHDLAVWSAGFEDPVAIDYAGMRVHKTGPWGQGPVFLQQLRLLQGDDLARLDPADSLHLVTEAAKLAFADRDAFYGDPDHVEVPLAELLSVAYGAERRRLVGEGASLEQRPGRPGGREPWVVPASLLAGGAGRGTGTPPDPGGGDVISRDTCQVDVVDRHGNMVAATPSGGWLHGSPSVAGLGFPLSTRGQMCWLDEASPSAFAAGCRPRTTLSPTIALAGRGDGLAFGTPGGDQQDQWTLGFFLRRVHAGLHLQAAIDAPSSHTSHVMGSFHPRSAHAGRLHLEARHEPATREALAARGHELIVEPAWSLGRVCAVGRAGGELLAGADPRQDQAYAVGR